MRIIYVTANLPHGTDEAFLIPEIAALRHLGHEVLVVPRSPSGDVLHGAALMSYSERQPLVSWPVMQAAATTGVTRFRQLTGALERLCSSRSLQVGAKNLAVAPKAAWLSSLAMQWGADHIHCHWAGTTATMTMLASHLSGVPWSFTLHRWDIVENNLLAEKAHSASLVRFISESGLRMARKLGIPDANHIRVIHMGVDMPPLHARPAGKIVLCPARMVEIKGHCHLFEAWRQLRAQGVTAELWLAGGGPLRHSLETMAANLGIQSSVRFLGTIPHNRLLDMYSNVGIAAVVLPSLDLGGGQHEGIPVALIEAMSHGIPVVGTNTGGMTELIQGGTGLMVRPGDSVELATAIQCLLRDPDGAKRLGEFGRRHVAQEFDVQRIAAELVSAFEAARPTRREAASIAFATAQ